MLGGTVDVLIERSLKNGVLALVLHTAVSEKSRELYRRDCSYRIDPKGLLSASNCRGGLKRHHPD
jgi:hypothetical protein